MASFASLDRLQIGYLQDMHLDLPTVEQTMIDINMQWCCVGSKGVGLKWRYIHTMLPERPYTA